MKCLILTDSVGNPRSFPVSEMTQLEETYPYLLRKKFQDPVFWQLSYGNVTSEHLISQVLSYLGHWEPDVIIVNSGICDCRPEAFTEFQKTLINKFSWRLAVYLKKYIYHSELIKRRQVYRTSPRSFRKTVKKLKLVYSGAIIFWLGICADTKYENARPGVNKRMEEFNQILIDILGENVLHVGEKIAEVNGYNSDGLHWNKNGHRIVAEILLEKITSSLKDSV